MKKKHIIIIFIIIFTFIENQSKNVPEMEKNKRLYIH